MTIKLSVSSFIELNFLILLENNFAFSHILFNDNNLLTIETNMSCDKSEAISINYDLYLPS